MQRKWPTYGEQNVPDLYYFKGEVEHYFQKETRTSRSTPFVRGKVKSLKSLQLLREMQTLESNTVANEELKTIRLRVIPGHPS